MKIVNLDAITTNPGDLSWDFLYKISNDVKIYDRTSPNEVVNRAKGAEILIINKTIVNKEILEKLSPELKFIALQSTGYNVVDMDTANKLGIIVSNIPAYSTNAVAQEVFAYILNFTNKINLHSDSVHNNDWCNCPDFCYWKEPLTELDNKTIGIIGFGSIGHKVAKIAEAFGMNILINSKSNKDLSLYNNAKQCDLDYLLSNSDFITCHCPLTPETNNLINIENIKKMKTNTIFINTSRGPVVNEKDLAYALNNNLISGAAVDVLSVEPPRVDNPLLNAKNCIITPHIAWAAKETRARLLSILESNISAYINDSPQNVVNNC